MKMKKLIPALCMLLVSAILLGTSTYAWFSMNTTVNATGMQITIKSDNTFLLINTGDNDTADEIQTAGLTTTALTVAAADADLYPAAPCLTADQASLLPASTGKKVGGDAITVAGARITSDSTADDVTNWYTATAAASNAATMLAGSARQLTSFSDYVIVKTAYLTVADGANNANNLTVTPTITNKTGGTDSGAIKLLIVTDDGFCGVFDDSDNGVAQDIKGNNTAITESTVRTVTIYIYYDGDDDDVYTNNKANLKGADISLIFNVAAVPAA